MHIHGHQLKSFRSIELTDARFASCAPITSHRLALEAARGSFGVAQRAADVPVEKVPKTIGSLSQAGDLKH